MEYKVVSGMIPLGVSDFNYEVNRLLEDGFCLEGPTLFEEGYVVQALVKHEHPPMKEKAKRTFGLTEL